MKTTIALLTLLSFGPAMTSSQAEVSVSLFYDQLEPYGEWMDVADYGYVWHPRDAGDDWRPYTDGRWAYTDAGWTWVSDEPYGWAVYHYGRWANLDRVGWVWVPGTEWGPAWVSWRKSERHVGWAPLPPEATFRVNVAIGSWADSYYDIGPASYTFVDVRNLGATRIVSVARPWRENITFINETRNITNISYQNNIVINQGPRYEEVVRVSEQPIRRLRLDRRTDITADVRSPDAFRTRVEGESLAIAAPTITRTGEAAPKRIGRKVAKAEVNRGWKGVGSEQEVQKLRAKVKSDAPQAPAELPKEPKFEREDKAAATTTAPSQPAKPGDATTPPASRPGQPPTSTTAGETPAKPGEKTTTTPPATDTPARPGPGAEPDRPGRTTDRPEPNADTPGRPGRSARPSTPDQPGTPADANRPGRSGRPDPSARPDGNTRPGTPDREGRSARPATPKEPELPTKPDARGKTNEATPQPDRPERTARPETPRPETPDRPGRVNPAETPDRPDRAETPRSERPPQQPENRAARPERAPQPENRPDRAATPPEDRPARAERPDRETPRAERPDAPAAGNRPERAERPQAKAPGVRPRPEAPAQGGNNPAGEDGEPKDPRAKKKE
jgi:hypothetical protein